MRKLNIGSGSYPLAGFDNADANPACPGLAFVCELDAIPAPDGTYDFVKATHVIEHVPIERARRALREWYRVTATGGRVHVDTPNLRRNAAYYLSGTEWLADFATLTREEKERCSLNGKPNRTLWFNFKAFSTDVQWDIHFANYDAELLIALVLEAGYTDARVMAESPSLIVEATKV